MLINDTMSADMMAGDRMGWGGLDRIEVQDYVD